MILPLAPAMRAHTQRWRRWVRACRVAPADIAFEAGRSAAWAGCGVAASPYQLPCEAAIAWLAGWASVFPVTRPTRRHRKSAARRALARVAGLVLGAQGGPSS